MGGGRKNKKNSKSKSSDEGKWEMDNFAAATTNEKSRPDPSQEQSAVSDASNQDSVNGEGKPVENLQEDNPSYKTEPNPAQPRRSKRNSNSKSAQSSTGSSETAQDATETNQKDSFTPKENSSGKTAPPQAPPRKSIRNKSINSTQSSTGFSGATHELQSQNIQEDVKGQSNNVSTIKSYIETKTMPQIKQVIEDLLEKNQTGGMKVFTSENGVKLTKLSAELAAANKEVELVKELYGKLVHTNVQIENKLKDSQKQIDELKQQMTQAEEDFEKEKARLNEQLCVSEKGRRELEKSKMALQKEVKQLSAENEKLTIRTLELKREEKLKTEHFQAQLYTAEDDRRKLEESIAALQQEKGKLTTQMSEMMSQQLSRDESNLENISQSNRPMKIAEEYDILCSDVWLKAKSQLDEVEELIEKDRISWLFRTLMQSSETSAEVLKEQQRSILKVLKDPTITNLQNTGGSDKSEEEVELPDKLDIAINTYLKMNTDSVNYKGLAKMIVLLVCSDQSFSQKVEKLPESISQSLQQYAEECCRLAWKMRIQKPPMMFQLGGGENGVFDCDTHEPHYGSVDPSEPEAAVEYFVYPALYHGSNIMKKAKVFLSKPCISDINDLD